MVHIDNTMPYFSDKQDDVTSYDIHAPSTSHRHNN